MPRFMGGGLGRREERYIDSNNINKKKSKMQKRQEVKNVKN